MRIELVIFDMDGLIFDTERVSRKAWKIAGEKLNCAIDDDMFMTFLGTNRAYIRNLLVNSFGESDIIDKIIDERNVVVDRLIDEDGLVVKKGLRDLIPYLKSKGIKIAVATSTAREKALNLLTIAGIANEFDYIICGDEVTKSKPNPEIFLKVAEKLSVAPENCIVLEDSRWGIQAAKNAGMNPIMVPDLLQPDEEILGMITHRVEHLGEVIEYLDSL